MPWFDILILALVAGQGASGYFSGYRTLARLIALVILLIMALPLARPLGREMEKAAPGMVEISESMLVPVSGGNSSIEALGPWQPAVGLAVGAGPEEFANYLARVKGLILSVLGYLIGIVAFAFPLFLLASRVKTLPLALGAGAGMVSGLLIAVLLLIMLPPVALTGFGGWLADGIADSAFSRLLLPITTQMAGALAKFFI